MTEMLDIAPDTRHTERSMLDLLHSRYARVVNGNGPRYVCAEHVRNAAGFEAWRTADLLAQDLWPSSGFEVHGHEVKVSRADWLRELAEPDKATAFSRYCHRWWLVVPDRAIVRGDLPDQWGLMAVCRREGREQLRVLVQAPKLNPEPMPRTMQVALLRAVSKTAARRVGAA